MYQIRRERYRRGTGPSDRGPEGGSWRYDVYIAPYESKEDCVEAIIRMERELSRDMIEYDSRGPWRLRGEMKPTGSMEYEYDAGSYQEYCDDLMELWTYQQGYSRLPTIEEFKKHIIRPVRAEKYWDEYYIEEL